MASSTHSFTSYPIITVDKLVGGENYASWAASVKLWFKGQGVSAHLDMKGVDVKEKKDEWEKVDALLTNMLWQSIDPKLHNIYKTYETCYEVWNKAKSLYTNDVQGLYSLVTKFANILNHRGTADSNMSEYLGQIEAIQQEFHNLMSHKTDADEHVKQYDKFFMVFALAGLSPDLAHVRDQILASPTVPTLNETAARLLRVASAPPVEPIGDSSVLVSRTVEKELSGHTSNNGGRRGVRRCEYCNKVGHTKDRCWKLHGKPSRSVNMVQTTGSETQAHSSSTPNDYEEYLRFKASREATTTSSSNTGSQYGEGDWHRA
ncbi:uncharacterized protein LOC116001918 [Ipomoea triloba]|uniref:uncharacterized protein LOC116001918 n=1 Tax=Ipomoea triloba TaxID=35885 RepID=UPI00125DD3BE|nr:uncharacterized protein LOC116001918 [Ipomoea triloba]